VACTSCGSHTIFPNHGSREIIVGKLLGTAMEPAERHADLRAFVSEELAAGWISWFEPYERVHQSNLAAVRTA
jgi:hypothetical protein